MDILNLFQYNDKLKFSDIEKALKVRSNKLAYHLKTLTKKGILKKQDNLYSLSETSEYLVPYLSRKKYILPAILIHIGNSNKSFLIQRRKRPFKGQLSLPGGRIIIGESISKATERIMKEKFNINAKLQKINSVSLEQVKKDKKILHSFILIFVTATTKDNIELTDVERNKSKIITSDYFLIKNDSNKKINVKTINTTKI